MSGQREMTLHEVANQYGAQHRAAKELSALEAELTRLRDFAREVNEAPYMAWAFCGGLGVNKLQFDRPIGLHGHPRWTELIARPRRMEGV